MKPLSRLLGIRGSLESELERARVSDAADDTGAKLDEAQQATKEAERRLRIVEARVRILQRDAAA